MRQIVFSIALISSLAVGAQEQESVEKKPAKVKTTTVKAKKTTTVKKAKLKKVKAVRRKEAVRNEEATKEEDK